MANGNMPWYKRYVTALLPGASNFFAPPTVSEPSKNDLKNALAYVDPSRLLKGWYIWPYNPGWLVSRKGLSIIDAMKRDEQVKAALKFKKDSVLSAGWEVISPGDQKDDWEVTRFVRDAMQFTPGGWNQVLVNALSGLEYGYSVQEKVFSEQEKGEWKGKLMFSRIQSIKPHYINFSVDEFGVLQSLIQFHMVNSNTLLMPPAKFIIYSHAIEFGNFYGTSDLEAAYRCYSSDTEVLTRNGWKLIPEVALQDEVATLNDDGELGYAFPTQIYKYKHKGKMFHQEGKLIDLMVTPNHQMWVQPTRARQMKKDGFKFIEAKDLPKHVCYKRDAKWKGKRKKWFDLPLTEYTQRIHTREGVKEVTKPYPVTRLPMNEWLWVLGIWLAEGYVDTGLHYVYICQLDKDRRAEILRRVQAAGLKAHNDGKGSICICSTQLANYLAPLGGSHTKYIPREFMELPPDQLAILVDGMIYGDGSHGRYYATVSTQLANDVSELALKMGFAATVTLDDYDRTTCIGGYTYTHRRIYSVGLSFTSLGEVGVKGGRSIVNYDGNVHCLEVPYHRLYVRRNGKACWCGNSWWTKDNAYKWLAVTLERFGMAPLFALYDPNVYAGSMVTELQKVVKGIQNATLGVIPRTGKDSLEFWSQEISRGSSDIFLKALERFDQHIARAVLVPDLTGMSSSAGQTGSRARSQTHAESFIKVVLQLQNDISAQVMNGQVIPQLCDLNFPSLASYPVFRFQPFTEDRLQEIIAGWTGLVAGQVVNKIEDDETHLRKIMGFPENENPKVLPNPAPKGGAAGGDGMGGGSPFGGPPKTPATVVTPAATGKPGETPLTKETKVVASEELSTEMKEFAVENDAVWVELEDGQRVAVPAEEITA